MGKILVFVSIVFMLLSAGLGFVNKNKLTETKSLADATQATLDKTSTELLGTKADLKSVRDDLTTVTTEKATLETQVAGLETSLETTKTQLTETEATKTKLESEITQLTSDLSTAKTELETAKAAVTGTSSDGELSEEVKAQLAEKEAVIAKLQSDLNSSSAKLETLRAQDEARVLKVMKKGLEGRVLAVNPAWNFVVLNLGDKNGVVSNAEMLVRRGTQLVGKVRVTSVEPSTSIADIVAGSVPQGATIAPGDNVIFQSSDD